MKTRAFHILNPLPNREYNPKLYTPTGNRCDPHNAALDYSLDQYQSVITDAMTRTAPTTHIKNMSRAEHTAIRTLSEQLKEGTALHIPIPADKDRAYCLVSPDQHINLWRSAMSGAMFTLVDEDSTDWNVVKSSTRVCVRKALESGVITFDLYRFLTQHCNGDYRTPVGNLLLKSHKLLLPQTALPAKTRLYIDTVNCITTPLAKYISVQLTKARDCIPHRIRDSRDLMSKISHLGFRQSIRFVTLDITDFYPNTTVAQGREVMKAHLAHEIATLCLEFSDIIHDSLVVKTPIGTYKLPDRYGIGLVHSCEICDLYWAIVEARVLDRLKQCGLTPLFYGRMIDDCIMILDCTDSELEFILKQFKEADPTEPVSVEVSSKTIDFLDVTLYKGHQFKLTGKLDSKLYTKPSSSALHLPRTSHHPESTFFSILNGEMRRSVIASSSFTNHQFEMNRKMRQFKARGYSPGELTIGMGNLFPDMA